MTELKDQLTLLGRKTEYKQDYAPEVLEAFDNRHPENDYWVRFNCPEFTSLCPITGQPDFAEIRISYIPDVKMVESKPQMANYDYTHINFRGGKHLAGLLFETLMYGKEQHEKRKAYENE